MTALVCLDTQTGDIRRYHKTRASLLKCTHHLVFEHWDDVLTGAMFVSRESIEHLRANPNCYAEGRV